jgi:hypothetical protein
MTNRHQLSWTAVVATAALLLAVGCGGGESADSTTPAQTGSPSAEADLPPDHPPVDQTTSGIAPPPSGTGQGSAALVWTAPDSWVPEAPSNAMRRAQYRVPGAGGDGECVVYYFGPGQGGDAVANAERWASQFSQPDGSSSSDHMLFTNLTVEGVDVLLVEVTGTYNSAMAMGGPTESFPDYMLLGAIAEGTDANWFFKFTGPEGTLRRERQAFEQMIHSLAPGG